VVNKTLQELNAYNKPVITLFNKMDLYIKNTFDEWLDDDNKQQILNDMKSRWQNETQGNSIFISALERTNIDVLRKTMLDKVRELYHVRYPYKTEFFY